ncbi:hypothetical protein [Lichenibacterium ramalinae]|uniref:CopG family transcriptional regulator n=1 Tax=Lichenibacterium ramalinae TaxID=2316527 RepID=A0A4Q2RK40_9HYPH|nr:hypothetical protein [Lichenibacterium ramalinae]RYB07633.1 hypothetical protein D3272_00420 [Lichenibacterium ramalinae]
MRDEYDFSTGRRGRFFHQDATLAPPVHLDADILVSLEGRAERQGVTLDALVNALLRQALDLSIAARHPEP